MKQRIRHPSWRPTCSSPPRLLDTEDDLPRLSPSGSCHRWESTLNVLPPGSGVLRPHPSGIDRGTDGLGAESPENGVSIVEEAAGVAARLGSMASSNAI